MDDNKLRGYEEELLKQKAARNYNFFRPVGQFIEHVDTINFSMDKDGTFHFENVGQVKGVPTSMEVKPSADDEQEEIDNGAGMDEGNLNFKSPTIVLQRMLEGDWFDRVSADKGLYNKDWRNKLVADLMASEHGAYIARLWQHEDKRLTIKGQLLGTLVGAGVMSKNKSAVARAFLVISDNTRDEDEKKEVNTFGKYIGKGDKEPYADWVKDYVDKMSQKKK